MSDLDTVERLARHTAESVSSLEEDVESLIASSRKLARKLAETDEKVSGFVIEYRRGSRDVADALESHQRTLERILEKLRST